MRDLDSLIQTLQCLCVTLNTHTDLHTLMFSVLECPSVLDLEFILQILLCLFHIKHTHTHTHTSKTKSVAVLVSSLVCVFCDQ